MFNKQLYNLHLENGIKWGMLWDVINQNISCKLETKMKEKYQTINTKMKKLGEQNKEKKKIPTVYKQNKNFLNKWKT
jgi:hypothetical protein